MNTKYFDSWLLDNALSLIKTNPIEAKNKLENYIKSYPKDYSAYPYYASVLITLGLFEEAEKILDYVEKIYTTDPKYKYSENKVHYLKHGIFINRLRLLSYQKRYTELHQLCQFNQEYIRNNDLNAIDFYSKKKAGVLGTDKKNVHTYLFRQIVDYSEEEFIEHIKKHQLSCSKDVDMTEKSFFFEDFPFDNIYNEIKKYIPSEKRLLIDFYHDLYIFKYDYCGKDKTVTTNYFKVLVLHDTKEIITMFPSSDCENLPYIIDLNYLTEKKEPKIKRRSQIDKFNQRYSK